MIARKERIGFNQRKGEVVGRMARRRHRFQRPALARDPLPIREHAVGPIVQVETRIGARPLVADVDGRGPHDRRAGRGRQRTGGGAMITVMVSDHDRSHRPAGNGGEQRRDMALVVRPRIDHRHRRALLGTAYDVSSGARESERTRVLGDNPRDQRCDKIEAAVGEVEISDKRNHIGLLSGGLDAPLGC